MFNKQPSDPIILDTSRASPASAVSTCTISLEENLLAQKTLRKESEASLKLAAILQSTGVRLFRSNNSYTTREVGRQPSAQNLKSPDAEYRTRVSAIAGAEGSSIPASRQFLFDDQNDHRLILFDDGVQFVSHGQDAMERLAHVSPDRFGKRCATVDCYVRSNSLVFVSTVSQLARHVCGGSQMAKHHGPSFIKDALKKKGGFRFYDNVGRAKNVRFLLGVSKLHIVGRSLTNWCRVSFPSHHFAVGGLYTLLVTEMLLHGKFRPVVVEKFLDEVELLHQGQRSPTPLSLWMKELPMELRLTIYKSRRAVYKDECSEEQLMWRCLARRQLQPVTLDGTANEVLAILHTRLRNYLTIHRVRCKALLSRKNYQKSSASVLFTRAQGGGNREIHFFVGLKRLMQGHESALNDVFGIFNEKTSVEEILQMVKDMDMRELREATDMLMGMISDGILPGGVMLAIFPERETKGRTFTLEYALLEVALAPLMRIARNFLRTIPNCSSVMGDTTDQTLQRVLQFAKNNPGNVRIDEDAQIATDYFPMDLPLTIWQPLLDFANDEFLTRVFRFHCGPTKLALATKRPDIEEILRGVRSKIDSSYQFNLEPPRWKTTVIPLDFDITRARENCARMGLRIGDHLGGIKEQCFRGPFILKAGTGAGKTILFASLGNVVISLPTIDQIILVAKSLEFFKIPCITMYAGQKRPTKDFGGAILCTAFYALQLCKGTKRLYINDEADSPMEDVQLNIRLFQRASLPFILCTATPSALKDCLPVVDCDVNRIHQISVEEPIKHEQLLFRLSTLLQEGSCGQVLIVTYSEPQAISIVNMLLNADIRAVAAISALSSEEISEAYDQRVIVTTNRIRSGVTLPKLTHVFDYQLRYNFVFDTKIGSNVGIICDVGESAIEQLKGRLGRVSDGSYCHVKLNIKTSKPWTALSGACRMVCYSDVVDLGSLPIKPDGASTRCAIADICFFEACVSNQNQRPLVLQNYKDPYLCFVDRFAMGTRTQWKMKFYLLCRRFNVAQSILELSRSPDASVSGYIGQYQAAQQRGNIFTSLVTVLQALRLKGVLRKQIDLIERSLGTSIDLMGQWIDTDFEDVETVRIYSLLNWQLLGRVVGKEIHGIYRDYRVSIQDMALDEGCIVLPVGLQYSMQGSNLQFDLCIEALEDYSKIFERSKVLYQDFFKIRLDVPEFCLEKSGKDSRSRLAWRDGCPRIEKFLPSDFEFIVEQLKLGLERNFLEKDGQKSFLATSGVNMGSEKSMPTLMAVAAGSALWTEIRAGFEAVVAVWGDDVAAVATAAYLDQLADLVDRPRASFGLIPKMSATGTQLLSDDLTVFTERFFNGLGVEFRAPSPNSFSRAVIASNPGKFFGQTEDVEDFESLIQGMSKHCPDLLVACELQTSSLYKKQRTTHSRQLAMSLLRGYRVGGHAAPRQHVDKVVGSLEELILIISPSSRGKPIRLPRNHLMSSLQTEVSSEQVLALELQLSS
jgi:hypothetical protein